MRKSSRFITAALVPTLTLGVVGLGTAATTVLATATVAAAAQTGPWSAPTALTGLGDFVTVVDVRTTTDGRTVAVWERAFQETADSELWTAVRPAGSAVWGTAHRLSLLPEGRRGIEVVPAADGSVTVTWVNELESGMVLRTSTLPKGSTTWSAADDIATSTSIGEIAYAGSPSGKSVAVWRGSGGRDGTLYVSERTGPGGTWSAPAVLVAGDGWWPQAAVAPDGAVTVVWNHSVEAGQTVKTVHKAAGATAWTAPKDLSATNDGGVPLLSLAADGTASVAWVAIKEGEPTDIDVVSVVRPAGSTAWGAPERIQSSDMAQLRAPLIAPNGEITLAWVDYREAGGVGVRTSTRSATGAWSPVKTLSTGYVPEQFDAAIGADGTVQVGWAQDATTEENSPRVFSTAARINGTWTAPTKLSKAPSGYAEGAVAVAPDGNATAVWAQDDQLWTAGTGLTTTPPTPTPAKRRDYVGADGFPDLYARTSTGGLFVYKGGASQTVATKVSGGTWPTTSVLIPFGDLNADGCNDTLVRNSAGEMHRYSPTCGEAVTPQSPALKLSTGWNAFDGFSYSGDFNRDGLPDLIARQISTGDLYMFAGTKSGTLTRTGKVGTSWKSLTLVGAGDLNGDKVGDLLARTTGGDLYRYYGTGTGTIGSGAKIGSGWGGMVNFVGVGDLTGDRKDDILGRTTGGDLYRYAGNGTGGIGSGVKIGTGWKAFTSIG